MSADERDTPICCDLSGVGLTMGEGEMWVMDARNQGEAFEQYRVLLFSIAYRMTGSATDAEDLVQETYLRYQTSTDQDIVSLKSYLTTITTRLALDHLKSARVAREQYIGTWLPEPILTSEDSGGAPATVEQQETLALAFLRILEALSPPERAVFLLHEVFDYPFSDIAAILGKSVLNCRQIFHRATQALQDKRTRFDAEPQHQRQLLLSFLSASQSGNLAALTNLLAQDATIWADGGGKVPSILKPVYGQQAVARLWLNLFGKSPRPLASTIADINGNPALLFWDDSQLAVVITFTLSADGIQEIYGLLNPDKLAYLQTQLAGQDSASPAQPDIEE